MFASEEAKKGFKNLHALWDTSFVMYLICITHANKGVSKVNLCFRKSYHVTRCLATYSHTRGNCQ